MDKTGRETTPVGNKGLKKQAHEKKARGQIRIKPALSVKLFRVRKRVIGGEGGEKKKKPKKKEHVWVE